MAFEGLTEKISAAFKKLRGKGRLKESDIKEAMREIRMALLEADVSYKVVKDFTKSVTERCIGADVLEALSLCSAPCPLPCDCGARWRAMLPVPSRWVRAALS